MKNIFVALTFLVLLFSCQKGNEPQKVDRIDYLPVVQAKLCGDYHEGGCFNGVLCPDGLPRIYDGKCDISQVCCKLPVRIPLENVK